VSTFLLHLITIYWYSSTASIGVTLGRRRDYIDGGGGVAAVTFA
jgi:hypothetical protein